ncbi:ARM repeat-containing protein [Cylindrobasidium torrendii FP15055 ss-10]|uniref:ARM repeat-containing protein n=1 Tax=Cylindrobasidium torrendii FP15055 ss-10 TaxID=1314674 RepID=A0A0D7BLQ0_9AGAR|nr:ARM repeat-containing protein [Cylindrobasidium torrendii FP15055 ss-10]
MSAAVEERSYPPSIWAPQPQPSDVTWPKTLDTFEQHSRVPLANIVTREDVFGPVLSNAPTSVGDIYGPPKSSLIGPGAIGEGRKRNTPPNSDFGDKHVEQLLRTLNLNSPDPKSPLSLSFDGSSEYSPASVSSALLTPTDLSPTRMTTFDAKQQLQSPYGNARTAAYLNAQSSLLFEPASPTHASHCDPYAAYLHGHGPHAVPYYNNATKSLDQHHQSLYQVSPTLGSHPSLYNSPTINPSVPASLRSEQAPSTIHSAAASDWHVPQTSSQLAHLQHDYNRNSDWLNPDTLGQKPSFAGLGLSTTALDTLNTSPRSPHTYQVNSSPQSAHEPINFLTLLHPSSSPPYSSFVTRIIKSSDQQASIFLQQKLKVADACERVKIIEAICARGFEMMAHRFGNWAVQRCLEASSGDERLRIVNCMRGRIVELATNCYGCHVLQKALDCEEDIRLLIVSELLLGDPAQTLVNKHASHVWSKIMELSWTAPAPPIFAFVNRSLKGKWAALACHETGSLVVQHAFENLEDSAKDGIVDELLNQGIAVFSEVVKSQWGSYCIQHILEHGSDKHRNLTLDHLISGLLDYATNEQGHKSVTKALKEGGKETLDRVVRRMCEPAKGSRRAMIVDLALSVNGSQLIATVLTSADKDQRAQLYDCIRGHIVTLRGCKTGSKVIWLFDRMRAYYGY